MSLLERYTQMGTLLDRTRLRRQRVLGQFVHPDIDRIMDLERMEWTVRDRKLRSSGVPMAGLGFAAPILPNTEPITAPASVNATGETNLYALSGSGSDWNSMPAGSLHAPQSLRVVACGVISNSSSGTEKWGTRIGTSSTTASNVTLGATGGITLGSTILTAMWWYEAHATILTAGTGGTMLSTSNVMVAQQAAATPATTSISTVAGNTTGTVDMTVQQNWSITVNGSNAAVICQLTQFMLAAWD